MTAIAPAIGAPLPASPAPAKPKAAEGGSLSFGDLLDVINPLQHIPVISTIYRAITGDKMSPTAEIAGGALYGGIIGAVGSIVDVLFTQATGKDFGGTVLAWLGFDKNSDVQYAQAKPAAQIASASAAPPPQTNIVPGADALSGSLAKKGVDPGLASRAAFAYRRAIGLTPAAYPVQLRPN